MRKAIIFLLFFCICFSQLSVLPAEAAWQPPALPSCNAVYLVNVDTNTVLYSKNANEKVCPASITKLMTAILTVEKFKDNLDQAVTVEHADIDPLYGTSSSTAGIVVGEQLTIRQLLYCLLMQSANESANVLAREVAGSVDNFVVLMNKKAHEIGAVNTHYVNPHGLNDPNHYTTAYDTYLIAKYAMSEKNSIIKDIVGTHRYPLGATNKHKARTLVNTNKLLEDGSAYFYKYCKGIKTGTTTEAGTCLVSYAVKDDYTYYCVAMGGPQNNPNVNYAFSDTKKLYQWAYGSFTLKTLVDKKEPVAQIKKIEVAWNKDKIWLYPEKQFDTLIPVKSDIKKVSIVTHVPQSVMAPIKVGQVIGTADVYYSSQKMGTINLISNEAVARSNSLYFIYAAGRFFSSIWFKILCIVLVALFAGYLALTLKYNHGRSKGMLNKRGSKKYKIK